MGLFKLIKGVKVYNDIRENTKKNKIFDDISSISDNCCNEKNDPFESPCIHLIMEEKLGVFGKRTLYFSNTHGDIQYIAKKTGTNRYPLLTLYDKNDDEVGFAKKTWSNYKPLFTVDILGSQFQMKQTTMLKSLYEIPVYGWQIKAETTHAIICDRHWKQIIQIEWEANLLKRIADTDTYQIKILHPDNEIAALVIALALFISRKPDFQ